MGPGSAAHRSAKCYALRCVRGTRKEFSFINIKSAGSYPRVGNLPYPAGVLSNEGALLEASLKWDRALSLAGAG